MQRKFTLIAEVKLSTPVSASNKGNVLQTRLISRHWLSKKAFEIELARPSGFQFSAGQTIRLIHGDIKRYYSIISAPNDPTLALCVRFLESGNFTPTLATTDIGQQLDMTGPHGYFTFNASPRTPVFVATGTGIAPFVSMVRSGVRGFLLLHGVSSAEDLHYEHIFREFSKDYAPCISSPTTDEKMSPGRFQGRVSDYIRNNLPRSEHDFYLCGRDEMVRDVTQLIDDCFPGSRVFSEVFF
jgi:ferredoxin-NADP reductase